MQFQQYARQLLAGYMKQRGIGVAAAVGARHCGKVRGASRFGPPTVSVRISRGEYEIESNRGKESAVKLKVK